MQIVRYVKRSKHISKRFKITAIIFASLILFLGLYAFNSLMSDELSQIARHGDSSILPEESDAQASSPADKSTRGTVSNRNDQSSISLWKGKLVAIDAGHGGIDPGTSGNGLVEKDINLDIALRLEAVLKKAGIDTYMTRRTDEYNDLKDVIRTINQKDADLVVSIHCDWYEDSSCNGTTTLFYSTKTKKDGNMTDMEFAEIIHTELMKAIDSNDRGIIQRSNLGLLNKTSMPSVIIEMGFLSNSTDAALLSSEEFRQKAAEGIAEGVKKALLKLDAKNEGK